LLSAVEAVKHDQIEVSKEHIVNITINHFGGEMSLMSETTNITGNTNSSIVNDSQHSSATTHIQQIQTNQPIDLAADKLIKMINDHLSVDTAKMAESLVKQATEEIKKADKDDSKIRGFFGVLEPLMKTALLIPDAIDAFGKWAHLLGM